ncbi:hypothetical protein PYW08_008990 [Mythimna loreyi]|uniref:Uncharacterized protein n=1 Tax=Mythimna loreyi TaxID=667449 RepID=A0ACC2Q8I6_9NEOP|nr:hypothetical protein PYW08_008990 [Mythimna loreyi]
MQTWVCVVGILGLSGKTSFTTLFVCLRQQRLYVRLGVRAWFIAGIPFLGKQISITCSSQFFYSQNVVRKSGECNLCFEKDCFTLDKARCDYYAETDFILPKDLETPGGTEDAAKRKEVDDLMFDLVAKRLSNSMECIPYVSRYTNCNKDNVCLDCKICSCSPEGKWLCTTMQPCHRQPPPLNVDHRILVMIMETLRDNTPPKKTKRAVTDSPTDIGSTITLEKLSEWIYGAKPLHAHNRPKDITTTTDFTLFEDNEPASEIGTLVTAPDSEVAGLTTMESITKTTSTEDTDYVAFDEVLRSIAVDPKPYNRRKPLDTDPAVNFDNNQTYGSVDYMMIDEDNVTSGNSNDNLGHVIDFMLDYDFFPEAKVTSATEVVIDLLPTIENFDNVNITENNINYNIDPNFFENTNDILQFNTLNIMKRDVTAQKNTTAPNLVPTVTIIVNTTNTTTNNKTEEFPELKMNVLTPLNKIISDKISELESLQRIKEDLQKFVKTSSHPDDIPKENYTASNSNFSIYNIALTTGLDVDLRRANPSRYDKYMLKLKSDIFAVLKDLSVIQRYKNSDIPEDLKLLMHAMKRYVYKSKLMDKPKRAKLRRQKGFRRMMEQTSRCDRLSFKDCLVQVIEVIDKDTPVTNALSPLSIASRNIMKHIIKTYYVDQQVMPGLRVHDPHYNLTNYLNGIGSKWQELSSILIWSNPFEIIHRMKLLQCTLTLDISKMQDAIGLIEFAHSRRMGSLIDKVNEATLDKIDYGLSAIHNKILTLVKIYKRRLTKPAPTKKERVEIQQETTAKPLPPSTIKYKTDTRKEKKRSFINHIRTLLKTSKDDIADLLQKNVPKSEIVKELAKKRLDEITQKRYSEYESTMRRWQQNLELTSRLKRSISDQLKTRSLKNIIPRYLRHKVNPRITENQKNATAEATRKADARKKKRKGKKHSRRGHKTRTTKTSKSKKSTSSKSRKVTGPPTNNNQTTKTLNTLVQTT